MTDNWREVQIRLTRSLSPDEVAASFEAELEKISSGIFASLGMGMGKGLKSLSQRVGRWGGKNFTPDSLGMDAVKGLGRGAKSVANWATKNPGLAGGTAAAGVGTGLVGVGAATGSYLGRSNS